jgi:hypothetical protein
VAARVLGRPLCRIVRVDQREIKLIEDCSKGMPRGRSQLPPGLKRNGLQFDVCCTWMLLPNFIEYLCVPRNQFAYTDRAAE